MIGFTHSKSESVMWLHKSTIKFSMNKTYYQVQMAKTVFAYNAHFNANCYLVYIQGVGVKQIIYTFVH